MLRSMTACGRSFFSSSVGCFSVDIQTINKRFLDIQLSLPRELISFELELRKWIAERLVRGSITVRINVSFNHESPYTIQVNRSLLKQLKEAWQQIYEELGINTEVQLDPTLLLNNDDLITYSDDESNKDIYLKPLKEAINKAIEAVIEMRKREGEVLLKDVKPRLKLLIDWIMEIAIHSKDSVKSYQKKLQDRINEYLNGGIENEERILREVCLYADRVDISEEIVRFKAHLDHFNQLLDGPEIAIGKTLDFLLQELLREINTIGSKSCDSLISRLVIQIKGELEKIREQVQNVE